MAEWRAIPRLTQAMQEQRDENPRGDLYRTLPMDTLLNMAEQNWKEVRLAIEHDNDVRGKCADWANYASFILDNYEDPPTPACNHQPVFSASGCHCQHCHKPLRALWVASE